MGLLQSTVDERQWGKSAVLEEDVEEVTSWHPRECLLALRCRREDRSVGQERGGVCVCVCVCVCVRVCLMCQWRRVLVSSFVHDSHRRRTLLCILCSVWPHRSVLAICVWTICDHFTLLLVLCCDSDSGEWVTCTHC